MRFFPTTRHSSLDCDSTERTRANNSRLSLASRTMQPKPACDIARGLKKKDSFLATSIIDRQLIRQNFDISTWLLMGATLQTAVLLLPIRPVFALAPAVLLLAFKFLNTILIWFGLLENPLMKDSVRGKQTARYPQSTGTGKQTGNEGVCMIVVSSRSNQYEFPNHIV